MQHKYLKTEGHYADQNKSGHLRVLKFHRDINKYECRIAEDSSPYVSISWDYTFYLSEADLDVYYTIEIDNRELCECGSDKLGHPGHSHWCKKFSRY